MTIAKAFRYCTYLLIMSFFSACGLWDNTENTSHEQKVEDVERADESNDIPEIEITDNIREELETQKEKQSKLIKDELNKSSFKKMNDEEIKGYLEEQLKAFKSNCDTAIFGAVMRSMRRDMRMKEFRRDEMSFSRDFGKRLMEQKKKCT